MVRVMTVTLVTSMLALPLMTYTYDLLPLLLSAF